jgi:nitroreductase
MTVSEAIAGRQSIRKFKTDAIPEQTLRRVLQSAQKAPSGHNYQPWKIIVVTDKDVLKDLSVACSVRWVTDTTSEIVRQKWVGAAPVLLVGCADERESIIRYQRSDETVVCAKRGAYLRESKGEDVRYHSSISWDVAIAFDHINLAAEEEGIGCCWIGAFSDRGIRQVLQIPSEISVELMMALGYPDARPERRPKKAIDDLFCFDRYCP